MKGEREGRRRERGKEGRREAKSEKDEVKHEKNGEVVLSSPVTILKTPLRSRYLFIHTYIMTGLLVIFSRLIAWWK